jgi:hypothetical protein
VWNSFNKFFLFKRVKRMEAKKKLFYINKMSLVIFVDIFLITSSFLSSLYFLSSLDFNESVGLICLPYNDTDLPHSKKMKKVQCLVSSSLVSRHDLPQKTLKLFLPIDNLNISFILTTVYVLIVARLICVWAMFYL